MPDLLPLELDDPEMIGDYVVVARLGAGGQGVVYLGHAPGGGQVAIKLLHTSFSGAVRGPELFAREIEAADRVTRYTARVLASGEYAGRPYIVTEYIAGESIQRKVDRDGPYGPADMMSLAAETAAALAAIHAAGLVHCDVKPANILAADDGPRIVDFGIARAMETIARRDPGRRGTPAYMAPEQVKGSPMGPHTDVFSWASTMVFAATGAPPFGLGNDTYGHGVMYRILHGDPELGGVPATLHDIVSACLLKNPAKRPSASDVVSMLDRRAAPSSLPGPGQIGDPLTGHTRTITCVAYGLADGGRPIAITGGHDRTARVWDLAGHQQIWAPFRHDSAVLAVACGVGPAGTPIALTGCQDHTLNMWDLTSGRRVGAPLRGHSGAVMSVSLTALDAAPVAVSVSDDRSVRLWDLIGHRELGPPLAHNNSVMSAACGELDGRTVAVVGGAWDQSVRVLDLSDRRQNGLPLTGHTNSVMSVACGRLDGRSIVITGGYDRTVRIWDLATRHELGPPLTHPSAVMFVAFGPPSGRPVVLTSGADRKVRVWDLSRREHAGDRFAGATALPGPGGPVAGGEVGGRPIAITCHDDLAIRLWSLGPA
ncbi:MAG TPA: protein kinase [Streptosporangiaceae bacterium]|nr:protein kinase [Streptosporangiaceae bacterium]